MKLLNGAACKIAKKILKFKPGENSPFILGHFRIKPALGTYKELINLYREGIISF